VFDQGNDARAFSRLANPLVRGVRDMMSSARSVMLGNSAVLVDFDKLDSEMNGLGEIASVLCPSDARVVNGI